VTAPDGSSAGFLPTEHSPELANLAAALAGVQATMRPALKDAANPHLKTKYADLSAVVAAIQPELAQAGLAILQTAEVGPDGQTYLATTLAHSSGEWLRGRLKVEVQEQRGINLAQAQGLALTYCRRYSIAMMVCVCAEDDDGHSAGPQQSQQAEPVARETRQPPPAADPEEPTHYFRYLARCQELKGIIGEEKYYEVLGRFGLKKSNEVDGGDVEKMKEIALALLERAQGEIG
tara:strand:+ start:978 stop:1679 length:702 start_codon:yes stop_codon:yes gene_type:complete